MILLVFTSYAAMQRPMVIQWFHRSFQEHVPTAANPWKLQLSRQCLFSSNGSGGSCSLSAKVWPTHDAIYFRCISLQTSTKKRSSIWPSTCNINFWDPNKTRFTHRWATCKDGLDWLSISDTAQRAHPLCKENVSSWSQFLCGSLYDPPWPSPVLHDAVSNIPPVGKSERHGWA